MPPVVPKVMFDFSDDVGGCKSGELDTFSWIETFDGLDQSQASDLDQVLIGDSSPLKLFDEALHEAWVYTDHQPAVPSFPRTDSGGLCA